MITQKGFLGKDWDHGIPGVEYWKQCLRVAKPGAHLLAFGGDRTHHRLACAIEDAGWELRTSIYWLHGQGMPKGIDISKQLDRMAGAEREVVGTAADFARDSSARKTDGSHADPYGEQGEHGFADRWSTPVTAPATDLARRWAGWNTQLKPSAEIIYVARKPFPGTIAANVMAHGCGALHIDACRVGATEEDVAIQRARTGGVMGEEIDNQVYNRGWKRQPAGHAAGRWPANVILSEDAAAQLDAMAGERRTSPKAEGGQPRSSRRDYRMLGGDASYGDTGGASRFFFCPKSSPAERNAGLDSYETISIQLSHPNNTLVTDGITWEDAAQAARLRVDTGQSPPRVICESTTASSVEDAWSTFLFGSGTTGRSLRDCRYTIATRTSSTTGSRTLSWLTRSLTSGSTADASCETDDGSSPAVTAGTSIPSIIITFAEPVSLPGAGPVASGTRLRISGNGPCGNFHSTVKPTDLMRWLVRLVTPPGGLVLDPFMGSGSTGIACGFEDMRFVGIEIDADYLAMAERRIREALRPVSRLDPRPAHAPLPGQLDLFSGASS